MGWTTLSAQFEAGAVGIPPDCPVEPGRLLSGPIYGPLLVDEDQHHFYFAGAGCLRLRGIAASDEPDRLLVHLETCVGKNNVASVLGELIDLLALENDLADYFKVRRRLGVVEHAFRLQDSPADRPMAIHAEDPGPRSRAPARRFEILRKDVAVNSRLQVRASLRNFDEVLMDRLLEMPADASMTSIDAPNHVTEAEVAVYGEHGDRVDFISGVFCQGFQFGLVAQGMVDQLPPPIPDLIMHVANELVAGNDAHNAVASGAAAFTIIVALHTILASTSAPIEHRIGAATDYIHWFGRLLRTETVNSLLEHVRDLELNMVGDLDLAVDAILECRDTLGTDLAESVQRLVDDPFISIALKDRLRTIGPSDSII